MTSPFRAVLLLLVALLADLAPAVASDVTSTSKPATEEPKPAAPSWTFGIEGSPEFFAVTSGSNKPGDLNNIYYKLSLSHRFAEGFVGGVSFQHSIKPDDRAQYYAETTLGYRAKLSDSFSLTPSVGAGYTWQDTGIIKGTNSNAGIGYYLVALAGDLKMTPKLTWNMFNVRYRNGFDATWVTPKVATGLTYDIDVHDAVYLNVGYAWKELDTTKPPYDKLSGDKFNIAVGYKRSF